MISVNLIYGHLYVLMFQNGPTKKDAGFRAVLKNATAPYCKDWNPRNSSNMSECLQFPWVPLRYPQITPLTSPKHPPDISRELKISTDDNRRQQTPPDTLRYRQVLFEYVWRCLLAHVVVCWHLEFPGDVWGLFRGCLGGVWGYMSGIHGN